MRLSLIYSTMRLSLSVSRVPLVADINCCAMRLALFAVREGGVYGLVACLGRVYTHSTAVWLLASNGLAACLW